MAPNFLPSLVTRHSSLSNCAALMCATLAAHISAAQFDLDPYSFREETNGVYRSFGQAVCAAPEPASPSIELHARIKPERCPSPNWAGLGLTACHTALDHWQLSFIKTPDITGSKHRFELKAMVGGVWGGENGTATLLKRKTSATWEYGREYDFSLVCSPERIEGTITDAATGKAVFHAAYKLSEGGTFPWRPAIHVNGELEGVLSNVRVTLPNAADTDIAPPAFPPFVPSGPETGLRGTATGFFHIETIDGRDWPIDPTGRAVILAGTQHISPRGAHSDVLGYSPYGRFVATNYPSTSAWADETLARLADWGFTMIGNACPFGLLGHKTLPHVRNIQLGQRVCRGDPDWYIKEWKFRPCSALPNVFHPQFAAACEWRAREQCAPFKDDPWLVGWFIDNELAWWCESRATLATGLFDAVAALPPEHSAKKELERWISKKSELSPEGALKPRSGHLSREAALNGGEVDFDIKVDFLRHYARTYYEKTTAAIRKADPNHMVMGSRYAGLNGAHPVVWEEAGRFCDIVTFNCYPWADLDMGIVFDKKGGVPMTERFQEYHGYAKKPLMITEWSFPAMDHGHPCTTGAGQRFRTQKERAEATSLFARTMLADPHVAGYDYFKWYDQPREGTTRWCPEDCNYGLVNDAGRPYPEITGVFKALHSDLLRWRLAPPPKPKPATPQGGCSKLESERERYWAVATVFATELNTEHWVLNTGHYQNADMKAISIQYPTASIQQPVSNASAPQPPCGVAEADGRWALSNGFMRLSGRIGSSYIADEIVFSWGADYSRGAVASSPAASPPAPPASAVGRLGALLATIDHGTNVWIDIDRVESATFSRDTTNGIVSVDVRATGALGREATLRPQSGHLNGEAALNGDCESNSIAFAISMRLSLAPGATSALAEIISFENLGKTPIPMRSLYMRVWPLDKTPVPMPRVPNLWKGPNEALWKTELIQPQPSASNLPQPPRGVAASWGITSVDASARSFRFWIHKDNGSLHPDASFAPRPSETDPIEIAPGASWTPPSPMSARIFIRQ